MTTTTNSVDSPQPPGGTPADPQPPASNSESVPSSTTTTAPTTPATNEGAVSGGPLEANDVVDQPSGTTFDAWANALGSIQLTGPQEGTWADAYVSSGDASAVTINYTTHNSDGSVYVSFTTYGFGTAVITILDCGDPSEDWTVVIDVDANYPPCDSNGVCP